jgi:hypothetical protein
VWISGEKGEEVLAHQPMGPRVPPVWARSRSK